MYFGRNVGRASPHIVGRGSTAATPRLVSGLFFKHTRPSHLISVKYGPCALPPWSISRPPTEHTPLSADCAWLGCGRMWDALHIMPSGDARPHQHRDRLVARASKGRSHHVQIPCRAARALFAPRSIDRPPTEHTPRSADLAWLCFGRNAGALLPTPPAGARPHQHRGWLAARFSNARGHHIRSS